jgi:glycosyltransferase involved in cell wall biosynthesis
VKVLLVAPHPFYTERGSPIAVRLLSESISRLGHDVTILTYHEGAEVDIPRVAVVRAAAPPGVHRVPIGPSWKKALCDAYLAAKLVKLLRERRFDVIHAVEEAANLIYLFRPWHRIPYVVDMDSSIPEQIAARYPWSRPVVGLLKLLERRTIARATATVAVCESLATVARSAQPGGSVHVIEDIPLLEDEPVSACPDHRAAFGIDPSTPILLYAGNLEPYQGIPLLLSAFARLERPAALVLVGGEPAGIAAGRAECERLGISGRVHWAGPRPLHELGRHLCQADVLVSPRTQGENTPMKVYSYLASGVPIVATDLPTHTQVLTPEVSVLTPPTPGAFARGIESLLADPERRHDLGRRARALSLEHYSREAFDRKVANLYAEIEEVLSAGRPALSSR